MAQLGSAKIVSNRPGSLNLVFCTSLEAALVLSLFELVST